MMLNQHIILIGMRGVGKTTLGKALAQKSTLPFCDLDNWIETALHTSIKEYVYTHGWEAFREKEIHYLQDVISLDTPHIIACGGGVIEREINRNLLKKQPYVIHITTEIEHILSYLSSDTSRPQLTTQSLQEEVIALWKKRKPWYEEVAKYDFEYQSTQNWKSTEALFIKEFSILQSP